MEGGVGPVATSWVVLKHASQRNGLPSTPLEGRRYHTPRMLLRVAQPLHNRVSTAGVTKSKTTRRRK